MAFCLLPRVSDYDRDPSRRSPPRGRCKCTFSLQVGLGKLSQSVDWPLSQLNGLAWAIVATVGGRLNDCENFKKTLVGVQWYSVHVSQTAVLNRYPMGPPWESQCMKTTTEVVTFRTCICCRCLAADPVFEGMQFTEEILKHSKAG